MNKTTIETILLFVRHGLTVLGSLLIAKGVTDQPGADQLSNAAVEFIGAALSFAGLAWSFYRKLKRAKDTGSVPIVDVSKTSLLVIFGLSAAIIAGSLSGCASPRTIAGRTLQSIGASVDAAMKAKAEAFAKGLISKEDNDRINKAHDEKFNPVFRKAILIARADLQAMAPQEVADAAADLIALIDSLTKGK